MSDTVFSFHCPCGEDLATIPLTTPEQLELVRHLEEATTSDVFTDRMVAIVRSLPAEQRQSALDFYFAHRAAGHEPVPVVQIVEPLPAEAPGGES